MAARNCRTSSTRPSSSTGTTTTAPGWWTTSRSNVSPDGSAKVARAAVISVP